MTGFSAANAWIGPLSRHSPYSNRDCILRPLENEAHNRAVSRYIQPVVMKSLSLRVSVLLMLTGLLAGGAGAQRAAVARHKRSNSSAPRVVITVLLNDPVTNIRRSEKNE